MAMSVPTVLSSHYQQHFHTFYGAQQAAGFVHDAPAALAPSVYRAGGVPIAFRIAELPGTAPAASAAAAAAAGAGAGAGAVANIPQGHYHHQNNAVVHHPLLDHHRQPPIPASASASAPPPRMATDGNSSVYMASDEEIAHLQKLSSEYEPEAIGLLVSERQPTSRITTEYSNADPIYRAKTAALPQKYSEYRACRGDGHCGWRAIAFSYFEALQRLGNKHKFLEEETRLSSLKNLLNSVGFQEELYEDFAEETFELLRTTSAALPVADNGAALLAAFNDQGVSMAIITHLKLLTSAWIQTHPNDFAPFIPGQDIKQYCASEIEPSICELDNIGLNALVEALVKPAGLALEVVYLDRSQGDEMNMYRYDPEGLPPHSVPSIRLLYRPGHYDILYKPEDSTPQQVVPPTPMQSNVYVGFAGPAAEYMPQDIPTSRANPELMNMIPGLFQGGFSFSQPQWSSSFEYAAASPFPALAMAPLSYSPVSPQTEHSSAAQSPQEYPAPPREFPTSPLREFAQPVQDFYPPQEYPHATLAATVKSQLPIAINRPLAIRQSEPFRPSAYELEPSFGASRPRHVPYQTKIFRNSHFNTAHYMNPDFQPEEWSPGQEYGPTHRGRNKSTSQ